MTETLSLDRDKNIGPCYMIPKKWEKPIRNVIEAQDHWQKCYDNYWPDLMPCIGKKGVYYYPVRTFVSFKGRCFGRVGPDELKKAGLDLEVIFKDQFVFDYSKPHATETQIEDIKVCLEWGAQNIFGDSNIKNLFTRLAQLTRKAGYTQINIRPSYHSDNPSNIYYNCVDVNFFRTQEQISSRFTQSFKIKPVDNDPSTLKRDLIKTWQDTLDTKIAKTEGTVNEYIKKLKKLRRLRAEV